MSDEERENRHHINFDHVTKHTAQQWAETFVSELNDTVVEAQLRITQNRKDLPVNYAVNNFLNCSNRLVILGFNGTLTEAVDTPGRRTDQMKEINFKLRPEVKGPLTMLCNDPKTTIIILSGSRRIDLDENFKEFDMWLAAEHGMFLRHTTREWMTTMPEHLNLDWVPSVYHVFEYFKDRTPHSTCNLRDISLVWNYKYADSEFGRLQARDMLQHLWSGPISNASVEVVQGSRSVEIRPAGVTKDEDVYTFFEPELPFDNMSHPKARVFDASKHPERPPASRSGSKASHGKIVQRSTPNSEKTNHSNGALSKRRRRLHGM